jgi:alpha-tubulin suppressor-like RCC1 family protein
VVAVAAGVNHSLAILSTGELVAWGRNASSQLSAMGVSFALAAAAGLGHTLALEEYQLGPAATPTWGLGRVVVQGDDTYTQVSGLPPAAASGGVRSIAAGYYHSLAVNASGGVMAWGQDAEGQSSPPAQLQVSERVIAC